MIFTRTVQAILPTREVVEAEVDFYVDENAIAAELGPRALLNKTERSRMSGGAVIAEVRSGSRRAVARS